MTTLEKIELLKNYLNDNKKSNDNFIAAEIDPDQPNDVYFFKFNYMIYSEQIKYITLLNLSYHIITIDNNIYLCFHLFI